MPEFIVETEQVEVNGRYRLGINRGYIYMMYAEGHKPWVTIGNDKKVDVLWDLNRGVGVCPYLDTYIIANCCLHSSTPIKVTLFWMIPILPAQEEA